MSRGDIGEYLEGAGGDREAGEGGGGVLVIIEAMKMEITVRCRRAMGWWRPWCARRGSR